MGLFINITHLQEPINFKEMTIFTKIQKLSISMTIKKESSFFPQNKMPPQADIITKSASTNMLMEF